VRSTERVSCSRRQSSCKPLTQARASNNNSWAGTCYRDTLSCLTNARGSDNPRGDIAASLSAGYFSHLPGQPARSPITRMECRTGPRRQFDGRGLDLFCQVMPTAHQTAIFRAIKLSPLPDSVQSFHSGTAQLEGPERRPDSALVKFCSIDPQTRTHRSERNQNQRAGLPLLINMQSASLYFNGPNWKIPIPQCAADDHGPSPSVG